MSGLIAVRKMLCVSCYCPTRESCDWRHYTFAEIKAAKEAGQSRDRFRPGEVCPKSLHRALHGFTGAKERWAARIATGLSDADLAVAIAKEFGEWHQGCSGGGYTAMGRPSRLWFGNQAGEDGKRRKPDLAGKALLDAVRELLEVPLPLKPEDPACEISQTAVPQAQAPWAGLPLMGVADGH